MVAGGSWKGSPNKHCFADTEIEIATELRFRGSFWGGNTWEFRVVATMRPRRPLSRLCRKTATDTADRIVLQVHFPETENEGGDAVITARSCGSVAARYTYSSDPWRTHECDIQYSTQVEYLGNSYAFSGELAVPELSIGHGWSF